MASAVASWWQQALLVTSLLANTSDFAAVEQASSMPPTSVSSFAAQVTPPPSVDWGAPLIPNIHDPNAINAQTVCPGYIPSSYGHKGFGHEIHLGLNGTPCNVYGNDIHDLVMTIEYQSKTRVHLNIRPAYTTPENESWYSLPETLVPAPQNEEGSTQQDADIQLVWTSDSRPFSFFAYRAQQEDLPLHDYIFATIGQLVFEDQFIELVTSMDQGYNIYGLGEVFRGLRLQPGLTRTIYAADAGDPIDGNIYGSHPFYLETKYYEVNTTDGKLYPVTDTANDTNAEYVSRSHGVYMRNAHAQEVLMHDTNITWRMLGGEIDMYFFSGPSQADVISQYLNQIGLPVMQQYWTFGYHQCRWGYQNWTMNQEVVDNFARFEIPLETMWNDIDYMKTYRDFDNDPIRFSYDEGAAFLDRLHDNGQHYVPIVDAAIYIPDPSNASDAYPIFDDGNEQDVFLKNPDGSLYIGQVWPGYTVFPDWLAANTSSWWMYTVLDWYKKIAFDGLWIDMNEVSSFCVGSCGSDRLEDNPVHPWFKLQNEPGEIVYDYPEGFEETNATEAASAASASIIQAASKTMSSSPSPATFLTTTPTPGARDVNYPPYAINHIHTDLAVHAVSPNATHQCGVQEYDVHNLYGHSLLRNTYAAIANAKPGERPFIIGRSTFVGSGNYSGHWGGDNSALFLHMYLSIPQALSFSLFGIPMFGVDTCGFGGNTDEELCNRWMQLSAFFPFYRNHNALGSISQEPYVWESVTTATKIAMNIRFQLLPYIYTLFYYAHIQGDTVMRALAWEFPNDPSLANADRQFFLGPAILVTPVLTQGQTTVDGVFPGLIERKEIYYDWYNQSTIPIPAKKNTTIDAPLGHIPVYIRGGNVLATQQMRMTTRDARKTDWSLIVAMGTDGRANGTLYLDDGVSVEPQSSKMVTINAQAGVSELNVRNVTSLRLDVFVEGSFQDLDLPLANITFMGVAVAPVSRKVMINGSQVGSDACVEYYPETQRLTITGLQAELDGRAWKKDWYLSLSGDA